MNTRKYAVYRTDSREEILRTLSVAIRQRYADMLPKRPDERERTVATLANALLDKHQQCKHDGSVNEVRRTLLCASTSPDECRETQGLIDELIEFTDYVPPDLSAQLKLWTGRLWLRVRRHLRGGSEVDDWKDKNDATGIRA